VSLPDLTIFLSLDQEQKLLLWMTFLPEKIGFHGMSVRCLVLLKFLLTEGFLFCVTFKDQLRFSMEF